MKIHKTLGWLQNNITYFNLQNAIDKTKKFQEDIKKFIKLYDGVLNERDYYRLTDYWKHHNMIKYCKQQPKLLLEKNPIHWHSNIGCDNWIDWELYLNFIKFHG